MMLYYVLFVVFVLVWIIGVYLFFNRKKTELKTLLASDSDIIATTGKTPKIRIVFDHGEKNNMDIKSLSDFTVKYSDLISGNYSLPSTVKDDQERLTGEREGTATEQRSERAFDLDMNEYVNIFTLKK